MCSLRVCSLLWACSLWVGVVSFHWFVAVTRGRKQSSPGGDLLYRIGPRLLFVLLGVERGAALNALWKEGKQPRFVFLCVGGARARAVDNASSRE